MRKSIVLTAILAASVAPNLALAQSNGIGASNFSYSTLGFEIGKAKLDDPLIFAGEKYEEFGALSISGGVQVLDNLVLVAGVSGIANDGPRTEISQTAVSFGVAVPIPLGDRVDLVPALGFARGELENCIDGVCVTEDDSFATYGVGVRAWIVPRAFEVSAGVTDSNESDSDAVVALGAHGWINDHHRLSLEYQDTEELSSVTVGYRYVW
ncbi:outer membrane beta-barrel protein [Marinobacter sp. X15-166B]|uniref:outer membrane beta-barrel protein n=1 Tax=Marinobacter sp. X15-166B TaxID=1897620 RepID=UPI00085C9F91|nr:outer membrane beta-barrel protein [Marinobacter sp. X15-166B]OEY65047.1 hypothetical protein BG841_00215 [Marinobacter sp. X15-166B]